MGWGSDGAGMDSWLDAAGRFPLLTPQQEITLGTAVRTWLDWQPSRDDAPPQVQRRGRRAREKMVNSNLRLVVSCWRRWGARSAVPPLDLLQEGSIGLVRAVEKFDPTRGYKFSTYAYWWVRQGIGKAINSQAIGPFRLPEHCDRSSLEVKRAANVASLDQVVPGNDGDGSALGDLIEGGRLEVDDLTTAEILSLVRELGDPDSVAAMELQYLDKVPPAEIAEALGVTRACLAARMKKQKERLRAVPALQELRTG